MHSTLSLSRTNLPHFTALLYTPPHLQCNQSIPLLFSPPNLEVQSLSSDLLKHGDSEILNEHHALPSTPFHTQASPHFPTH
jgi:hypothetical protein